MKKKFRWRIHEKAALLAIDAIFYCIVAAILFIFLVPQTSLKSLMYSPGFWFIVINILGWNYVFGNYEIEIERSLQKTFKKSVFVFVSTLFVVISINYLVGKERSGVFGRGVLAGSLLAFWSYLQISRWLLSSWWRSFHNAYRWLFIADSDIKAAILNDCEKSRISFSFDWRTEVSEKDLMEGSSALLGVVFAAKEKKSELVDVLMKARLQGVSIVELIEFYETYFNKIPVYYLSSDFFSFSKGFTLLGNPLVQRLKRLSDVLFASLVLIPGIPLMLMAAIGVRLESEGSVIFRQKRTGKDGRTFILYKFRSMKTDAEKGGAQWAKVNDSRVTKFGKFIRKTRLDELPQLWNILKGDMSFVGPRPERPEFNQILEKEIPFYQFRHLVRPGLTGWAQVHYPYGASKEDAFQKLQFDLYYVKNFSLILDLQIVLKTIRVVILGQGR